MSSAQRGCITFLVIIGAAAFFCGVIPALLAGANIGVALPVIQLPGEILIKDFPVLGTFTNTLVGILLTDLIIALMVLGLRNPKLVPSRFQSFFELFVDYLYNMAKQVIGHTHAPRIFPLIGTIFFVVLIANWLELVPGVDSIGIIHCAEEGKKGYALNGDDEELGGIETLKVSKSLDDGEIATEEDYHACEAKWFGHVEEAEASNVEHETETEPTAETEAEGETTEGEATEAEGEHAETEDEHTEAEGETAHAEEAHHGNPDKLIVTPFVRAAATDLNFTLALALTAFFTIQYFGVRALGVSYFYKFVNLPALGNLGKNPGGLMDFVVGLLEVVSELSKIISFSFRLLGNIFAGQVLLFVMAFLAATLLPAAFYGLELFVGLIQAFVFFMLTLVFSKLAMEGHGEGHDEEHHAEH